MKQVSLLRGINVSGHKKIKMAALKALYEQLGFTQVVTYIQSGNVVFETSLRSRRNLQAKIAQGIAAEFGFSVPVVLRTGSELGRIVAECPFGNIDLASEGSRVGVAFLATTPAPEHVAQIQRFVTAPEELVICGQEIYLRCPDGFGQSKLNNAFLERQLKVTATARNWKTVHKLLALTEEKGSPASGV